MRRSMQVKSVKSSESWKKEIRKRHEISNFGTFFRFQEVIPGLYLGPYSAASRSKLESLLERGITHIVCVRQDIEAHFIRPNFPERFQWVWILKSYRFIHSTTFIFYHLHRYLVLDIADTVTENIIQHFHKVKIFVDEALNSGGRVLVHGNAGISRSAALVLAYIMETYGLTQRWVIMFSELKKFITNSCLVLQKSV